VALSFEGKRVRGEAMIGKDGIEGGAIYALSALLRDTIKRGGGATLIVDLKPDVDVEALAYRLSKARPGQSLSTLMRKSAGLSPVAAALVREPGVPPREAEALAQRIKALPLKLLAVAPIARAISTAGGVAWDEIDEHFMLRRLPGVFIAGEMIDWEAPTGGYLLQACFATGRAAGLGAARQTAAR
jgi:predicted flavoprotein YhiN